MSEIKVVRRANDAHAVAAELEIEGKRVWIAFYTRQMLNGWQPYDQPNPAAYLPLGYKQLHILHGAGGCLLVAKDARSDPEKT